MSFAPHSHPALSFALTDSPGFLKSNEQMPSFSLRLTMPWVLSRNQSKYIEHIFLPWVDILKFIHNPLSGRVYYIWHLGCLASRIRIAYGAWLYTMYKQCRSLYILYPLSIVYEWVRRFLRWVFFFCQGIVSSIKKWRRTIDWTLKVSSLHFSSYACRNMQLYMKREWITVWIHCRPTFTILSCI